MAAALTTAAASIVTDVGTAITAGVTIYVVAIGIRYIKGAFRSAA